MSDYDERASYDRLCTEHGVRLLDGPCTACGGWVDQHEPHDSERILCDTCRSTDCYCETCRREMLYAVDEDDTLCPNCGECEQTAGFPATEWFSEPTGEWVKKHLAAVRGSMRLADLALNEAQLPSGSASFIRKHAILAQLALGYAITLAAAVMRRTEQPSPKDQT